MNKRPVPGSLLGIDVSHWQGKIDWTAVAASSTDWGVVEFAYAKASTGETGRDKRFVENAVAAAAAGMPFGAYHWIRPGYNTPAQEAANFAGAIEAARAAGARVELAPMIDLEEDPASTMKGEPQEVWDYVNEFAAAVKARLGQDVILYVGSNYAKQFLGARPSPLPVWVPQYNRPSCTYDPTVTGPNTVNATTAEWAVWQFCSKGRIPGIGGKVDLNALRGDRLGDIGLKRRRAPATEPSPSADDDGSSTALYSIGGIVLLLIVIAAIAYHAA